MRTPRLLAVLAALAALAAAPRAQPAGGPADGGPPSAHAVPFGSAGNVLELELAAPAGPPDGAALDGATVAVASAPPWLAFAARSAPAEPSAEPGAPLGVPVARLAFDVSRAAPVGAPAEVVVEVRSGGADGGGAVLATHAVRLVVSAPAALALGLPRPNPSAGAVAVPYEVPSAGDVRVTAHDVLGREVAVLAEGERGAGAHEARLASGSLAAGVYVVRVVAGGEARVRRLTIVR